MSVSPLAVSVRRDLVCMVSRPQSCSVFYETYQRLMYRAGKRGTSVCVCVCVCECVRACVYACVHVCLCE